MSCFFHEDELLIGAVSQPNARKPTLLATGPNPGIVLSQSEYLRCVFLSSLGMWSGELFALMNVAAGQDLDWKLYVVLNSRPIVVNTGTVLAADSSFLISPDPNEEGQWIGRGQGWMIDIINNQVGDSNALNPDLWALDDLRSGCQLISTWTEY